MTNVNYQGIVAFVLGLLGGFLMYDIQKAYPFDVNTQGCVSPATCMTVKEHRQMLPPVTLEEALKVLERDAKDPVYYHGRVAARALEYIRELEAQIEVWEEVDGLRNNH
jgi:hypothetical protein